MGGDQNGPPPVALAGTTAFVTTGTATDVVDTTSGRVVDQIAPVDSVPKPPGQDQAFADGAVPRPLVEPLQGRPTALVGYVVQIPGHGTTPPALALEIDAIGTAAQRLWTLTTPLPGQPSDLSSPPAAAFVGAVGDAVATGEGDSDDGYVSEAIDLDSRRALWQNRSFLAVATVGNTVNRGATGCAAPPRVSGQANGGRAFARWMCVLVTRSWATSTSLDQHGRKTSDRVEAGVTTGARKQLVA